MKRRGAVITRERDLGTGRAAPGRFTVTFERPLASVTAADFAFALGDREQRATPVGLVGIANMAPLVVGPRCVVDPPCRVCWYCKTWPEREPLMRFMGSR